jgi:Transglycosylase SLT domain
MAGTRTSAEQALLASHGFRDSVTWCVTPKGVLVAGKLERTPGDPNTVTHVWETYHDAINAAGKKFGVPAQLIIATICTESNPPGNALSIRTEPGFKSDALTPHLVSPGLMQTLISTARSALRNPNINRTWLLKPANSIMAGTAVIKEGAPATNLDPPKVAAAYNAGSLKFNASPNNRWRMLQFPIGTSEHVDRFVKWFNDACAALAAHPIRPVVGLEAIIGDAALTTTAKKVAPAKRAAKVVANKQAALVLGPHVAPNALTPYSRRVLNDILAGCGLSSAFISSGQRTPPEQARAMYDNCETQGVASQLNLYGPFGDMIIQVYVAGKKAGKTAAQIQADMTKRIIAVGPTNVSHHAADPKILNVFDVAPSSIPLAKQDAFQKAVLADKRVHTFFSPHQGDPGFHIEIPQPPA